MLCVRFGNGRCGGRIRPSARGRPGHGTDGLLRGSSRPAGRRPAARTLASRPGRRDRHCGRRQLPPAARTWCGWNRPPTRYSISPTCQLCAWQARDGGALVAVDNTFATPLLQQPIALGAHIAVHSATKFLGGHSDLLLGLAVADTPHLAAGCAAAGRSPAPYPERWKHSCVLRGLRTLALRLDQGQRSAADLAQRLAEHPAVTRVRYPGMADHPGHAQAATQMTGFGAVIGFEVQTALAADTVCDSSAS